MSLVSEVQAIAQKYQIPGGLDNPYTTLNNQVRTLKDNNDCLSRVNKNTY